MKLRSHFSIFLTLFSCMSSVASDPRSSIPQLSSGYAGSVAQPSSSEGQPQQSVQQQSNQQQAIGQSTALGAQQAAAAASQSGVQGVQQSPLAAPPPPEPLLIQAPKQSDSGKADAKSIQDTKTMPDIHLAPRISQVIALEDSATQILLTDPKIADVQLPNAHTMYVYGRTPGTTEIIVTSANSNKSYRYRVVVKPDFHDMSHIIQGMVPSSAIKVTPIPEGVLLQGTVESATASEDIRQLAKQFVGQQGLVINHLKIKNSSQINLRVKIAEVKRTVVNQLGINWAGTANHSNFRLGLVTGRNPIDSTTGSFARPSTANLPLKSFGGRFIDGIHDVTSLIDALAQEKLATVLAEPNLITSSGEEASFLVGGEFPYPVAQGTGTSLTISYQFKQYGITIGFLPVVMGNTIVMRVRTEVSDLDSTQTIRDQIGNNIPAIRTRRAESTVEMGNGQSMVLAGLLSETAAAGIDALPGLADIPILGALFRSNDFLSEKTELVITVTPYNVEPVDTPQDLSFPTDGLKFANLMDMFLFRQITRSHDPLSPDVLPQLQGDSGFYF